MKETALLVAGVIFLAVSAMHLLRFILKIELKVGAFIVPLWLSLVGFIVPLLLAIWMFKSR